MLGILHGILLALILSSCCVGASASCHAIKPQDCCHSTCHKVKKEVKSE